VPVTRAAKDRQRHHARELDTPAAAFGFDAQPRQAVDVGLLGSVRVGPEVQRDRVGRGPGMRHAQDLGAAHPVDGDAAGTFQVVATEEAGFAHRQRSHGLQAQVDVALALAGARQRQVRE
jgi:hypothetical protein